MNGTPFAQAAERLDRVVKAVKGEQLAATGAQVEVAETTGALHPEEAWARRFACHPIRPAKDMCIGAPPLSAFVAPLAEGPKPPSAAQPPAAIRQGAWEPAAGHIGSGLGKPGPRRSWVARLFRGR